jgi:formate hydrogenlyase subunit 3/multisubunit Na+/H+ antiporter MnhD subunit
MSLRIFHIVFVMVCIALSIFVAAWGWKNNAQTLAITFAVLTLALIVYGVYAFRKLREME